MKNKYWPTSSGELDQPVELQKPLITVDEYGGNSTANEWEKVTDLWAKAVPVRSTEKQEGHYRGVRTVLFIVYRADSPIGYEEDMRIIWDAVSYTITAIKDWGQRSTFIQLEAQSGISD